MDIGMIGYSPASVNVIQPLIKELKKNFKLRLMVLSAFAELHWNEFKDVDGIEYIYEKNYEGLDLIIYNTGSGGEVELNVPLEIKGLNIISLSIQDIFWDSKDGYKRRFKNTPDYIIVTTDSNKNDVLDVINIKDENVLVLGNPHFDRLKEFKLIEDNPLSVTFLSQCSTGGSLSEPTSDECKIAILELLDLRNRGIITDLKIYKHPRENLDFYIQYGLEVENSNIFEDMMKSGIIVSCGSTPHYEAMLLGKRTLFSGRGSLEEKIKLEYWDGLNSEFLYLGSSTHKIVTFIQELNI